MNSRVWMIGILLILAVICSTALALVDIKIAPVIEKNNQIKYMKSVLDVFGVSYDALNQDSVISTYKESIEEKDIEGLKIFSEKKSGQTAISCTGGGFQAQITLLVALKDNSITGFKVLDQTETPGLGARITEENFQKSFIGKRVDNGIKLVKTGNAGETEFDAITGATETSKAVQRILNNGFSKYFELMKKQGA
jgi:RnfABCDGE-type electron transport complex G subunit